MNTQPERKSCVVCGKSCKVGKKDGLISSHGFRQLGRSNNKVTACIGSFLHWTGTLNDLADKLESRAIWFEEQPGYGDAECEKQVLSRNLKHANELRQTASKFRRMAQAR